jgi:hypothetical protein
MLDLAFTCLGITAQAHSVGPTLLADLRIEDRSAADVRTIALRCQIRIEPQRRQYSSREADRALDLFGERSQWTGTMHPMQLASVSHLVPAFRGAIQTTVPIPCTYDMEVASTKYFATLDDGDIPLTFLFSGTVFLDVDGRFVTEPVPWHHEAQHRLPIGTWREMMDQHFPNQGWLRMRRDTLDAFRAYATHEALVDADAAVERLLKEAGWPPA